MNTKTFALVFALAWLDRSDAFAHEMPQLIPDGIVEHFIDPYKADVPEFPDCSAAEEVPAITQDPNELAKSLPEESEEEHATVVEAEEKKSEELIETEVAAAEESPDSAEAAPSGIAEQFVSPDEKITPEAGEIVTEIEEAAEFALTSPVAEDAAELGDVCLEPEKRWYFEIKPAYYFLTDKDMREFFGQGGFTARVEAGCKVWGPMIVWFDGSYFQKSGTAIGGTEGIELKLATITLGLKGICYWNDYVAMYAGAGPRLFMMMMSNDSPFVRGDDNEIGIGGGFDAGFWIFPIPQWRSFFLDLFADYSWKKMKVEEDEISSLDSDVDVSGLSIGLGIGIKF